MIEDERLATMRLLAEEVQVTVTSNIPPSSVSQEDVETMYRLVERLKRPAPGAEEN